MVAPKQGGLFKVEGGVLDHASKPPLSKTEINLHRLLKSCERQAAELDDAILRQDLRFANYVAVARDLLSELQGREIHNSLPSISASRAEEYEKRIGTLEKRVDEQTRQATTARNEAGSDGASGTNHQPPSGGGEPPQSSQRDPPPTSTNAAEPQLRQRSGKSRQTELLATKAHQSGGKLDQDVSRVLDQHRQLQEGLTDEMVELARAIKNNSLAMEQSMKETGKVLDATERAVEHSIATTSHVNTRASKIYSATFRTGCFTWLVLLAVSAIFFGMVFLIRIT
ncbi:hypothetical protein KFL_001040090 [Klebsormidium nitens]|uniref:Vesicle transport protein n=1 Tax=Klebsormidium nitens TaxID=105231 RepID=A0A1Y1I0A4_KLENI|nr:hypothetical protein KFL_001040090 [Klebsormidium nitens]|eukprot:GAQ82206.1 hypothetical protein KFL_001040090 [Klebsormidium nitens]